jgi:hypothetical protein
MASRKRDQREPSADERALAAVNEQLDKAIATYADLTGKGLPDADNLAAFIKVYGRHDPAELVGLLSVAVQRLARRKQKWAFKL